MAHSEELGTVVEYVNTYDFPNAPGGHFFYTDKPAEQAIVDQGVAGAFVRTGRTFKTDGATPVCRFYGSPSPGPNSHFFTANQSECDALRNLDIPPGAAYPADTPQWNYEGIGFLTTPPTSGTCPGGTVPIYRGYNNACPGGSCNRGFDSNHRFSVHQSDIQTLVSSHGWIDEGVKMCAPLDNEDSLNVGLLAYYPFDGNAHDASGNNNNGSLIGNAYFGEGVRGQALHLDGDGDYVDLGNGLNLYDKYSVSVWIKPEDLSRRYPGIFAKYETNHYGPYDFDLHYGKVNLWVSDGSGGYDEVDTNSSLVENQWFYIAYVVNNRKLKIFINSIPDIEASVPLMTQNNDKVTVGRQALMFDTYNLQFKGAIDELRVYGRDLSEQEIELLFKQGVVAGQ